MGLVSGNVFTIFMPLPGLGAVRPGLTPARGIVLRFIEGGPVIADDVVTVDILSSRGEADDGTGVTEGPEGRFSGGLS